MPYCGYCCQALIKDPGSPAPPVCNNNACPANEKCPLCQSKNLSIIYIPGKVTNFECSKCGYEWKKPI